MGAPEKALTLTIAAAPWSVSVADLLAPCVASDAALIAIGRQVVGGVASAFVARNHDGFAVGAFVLRVDGDQGVIVAAAGDLQGVSLIPALLAHIEARFIGCRSIRFHTGRPGMAHVMGQCGYRGAEVVMQKDLNYAQF